MTSTAASSWTCLDCSTRYSVRVAWCSFCGAQGRVLLLGQRPTATMDLEPELGDAASIAALAAEPTPVPAYPSVKTGHGALVILAGAPSGGKSTMAANWLNSLAGPVIYISHEEGISTTLAARLARLAVRRRDFKLVGRASVDQVVAEIRRQRPIGVVIDSIQTGAWEPSDLRHLLALHPRLGVVIGVCQVNVRGTPEGRRALSHEADVIIEVADLHATITKSRYQEVENGKTRMPVLLGTARDARDEVRRKIAPVLRLHRVQREDFPAGDELHRGTRDDKPTGGSLRGEGQDRPHDVATDAGDANQGGTQPPPRPGPDEGRAARDD